MKKNLLLLASVATVALSGCSNEEIANVETSMQNAIGFNVVGSNPGTRANPVTNGEDLKANDFVVFAFETGKTGVHAEPFMGSHGEEYAHKGVEITWSTSKWDYKIPEELAYWPTVGLDFYAVAPVDAHDAWAIHSNSQKIQYTFCDEFNPEVTDDKEESAKNVDVMYATAFNQTKESNNGKVKLEFKHALSQVVFRARTEKEGMEVQVKKMLLYNTKVKGGVFTLPAQGVDATKSNWGMDDLPKGGGSIWARDANTTITVGYAAESKDATWLSDVKTDQPGESNVLMMLPQTLTKWATTPDIPVTTDNANNAKQCYLSIECSIKQNGLYLFGSADKLETLYVPFGADWEPGYRYIYTLIFGGGYDKDGKPILTPIEFDPEVTQWTDSPEDIDLNS